MARGNTNRSAAKQDWEGRQAVVLGLARQGKALARFLAEHGAHVIVSDQKSADELAEAMNELKDLQIEYVLGAHPVGLLLDSDVLFLSGGIPSEVTIVRRAREAKIPISNDSQLFMQYCQANIIGITGSAGKSTTTALVGEIVRRALSGADQKVWVGGNIGRPLLLDCDMIEPHDWVVMELSSFQLEWMTISPAIAAVLNVSPNHLDRHLTMEAYTQAKARILDDQDQRDIAVLGRDSQPAWELRHRVRGRLFAFGMTGEGIDEGTYLDGGQIWLRKEGRESPICSIESTSLRGHHNLENILAACAIVAAADLSTEVIDEALRKFQGLPHRLEFVRHVRGVDWYNDSIATSPERAIAAIESFNDPIVLLAGGKDKDLPWEAFAKVVLQKVDHLILFGEAANKIAGVIQKSGGGKQSVQTEIVESLEGAVAGAARVAKSGDVVLLAPGGTSFDQFRDFEARGERFRQLVEAL